MVEANQRVHQIPNPNHAQRQAMDRAVRVLAIREAVKAVKQRMRSQGFKVQYVQRNVIVAAAEDYLAVHRSELVAEATKIVERRHTTPWPTLATTLARCKPISASRNIQNTTRYAALAPDRFRGCWKD
jgi:hypothetical protein